jgi:hypothetical protein
VSTSPQSDIRSAGESTASAAEIRTQLRKILAHPLFTNSKRYPVLLAYTVEQTLQGKAGELKERTIGVEAFRREPAYDVNIDPVVRTTAAEVRKRLIQYYYNSEHTGELVIELPLGSYVPSFHSPGQHALTQNGSAHPVQPEQSVGVEVERLAAEQVNSNRAARAWPLHHWPAVAAVLVVVALIGFGAGRIRIPGRPSNLERFWEPVTATSNRVTYCLGEPTDSLDRERAMQDGLSPTGSLNVSDVVTLARSIVPLVPRNGAFRVVAAQNASYEQLREGPVVLIGAFDNPWTMRIEQSLPFRFELDHDLRKIVDYSGSPGHFWTLQWQVPNTKLAVDYAIVARVHDSLTGQPVILLGGILAEGTEAAGEVVSNPAYMDALLQQAPKNWNRMNLEAVIKTDVIDGHPGPPKVVAVKVW